MFKPKLGVHNLFGTGLPMDSFLGSKSKTNQSKLLAGAVLRVELKFAGLLGFDHYGIYTGNKRIRYFSEGLIRNEPIQKFVEGTRLFNVNKFDVMSFSSQYTESISLDESYKRALSRVGMTGYNVLDTNCEHFALWCRTGEAISSQAFGSRTDKFNLASDSASLGSINMPRLVGHFFNKLGMKKSRTISINDL